MRSILSNPADIPAELITDPSRPVPPRIAKSKKLSGMLADLRDAYQRAMTVRKARPRLADPQSLADYLIPLMAPLMVEHLAVIPVDARLGAMTPPILVTRGDVDAVDAGPRTVFRAALMAEASGVIIAHNHPTGDPSPSAADRAVTQQCALGGKALQLPLHEHIIIAGGGGIAGGPRFYSLRANEPSLFR